RLTLASAASVAKDGNGRRALCPGKLNTSDACQPFGSESIMRITVDVPDAQVRRLEEAARRLKGSPDALAAAARPGMVAQGDADFAKVAERISKKYRDLYRRLT